MCAGGCGWYATYGGGGGYAACVLLVLKVHTTDVVMVMVVLEVIRWYAGSGGEQARCSYNHTWAGGLLGCLQPTDMQGVIPVSVRAT